MSDLFTKLIINAFGKAIQEPSEEAITNSVEDVLATPGLSECISRAVERQVQQFAETELGVPPMLRFTDEFEFFDDYLRPAYETGGASQDKGWCGRWWEHPSARFRIRSMWQAYELLARKDPASCDEVFLRTIGDHHMDRLTGDRSPMFACQTAHQPSKQLKSEPTDGGSR